MGPQDLQRHFAATYLALRAGLVSLGLTLPWVLLFGGLLSGQDLLPSMSDYYYTGLRDVFVGVLVAVGGLLIVYKGYSRWEDGALNLGGLFLAGVAFIPMQNPSSGANRGPLSLHGLLAVLFFVCIAYVCIFRASDTLALMQDKQREARFRKTYRRLGIATVLSPLAAVLVNFVLGASAQTFFVEAFGVSVFAFYWMVKSREMAVTGAESLAARGKLRIRHEQATGPTAQSGPAANTPALLMNMFQPAFVERVEDAATPASATGPNSSLP